MKYNSLITNRVRSTSQRECELQLFFALFSENEDGSKALLSGKLASVFIPLAKQCFQGVFKHAEHVCFHQVLSKSKA